jgi:hypothetical protein
VCAFWCGCAASMGRVYHAPAGRVKKKILFLVLHRSETSRTLAEAAWMAGDFLRET